MTFKQICNIAAAVRCLNAGHSFVRIARSAKRSPATIRRWVNQAGFKRHHGIYKQTS